jgi:hypothetical protein
MLNGSLSSQTIGGSTATTFYGLTMNNTYGTAPQILMDNDLTVTNNLTLSNGVINTGSYQVKAYNPSSPYNNATISRTNGYVNGNLRKFINDSTPVTFEVGTSAASDYTPLTLTFSSVNQNGSVIVSSASGKYSGYSSSGLNSSNYVNVYWTVTNAGTLTLSSGSTFKAAFGWQSSDNVGTYSTGRPGWYHGSWTLPGTASSPAQTSTSLTSNTLNSSYWTSGTFVVGQ